MFFNNKNKTYLIIIITIILLVLIILSVFLMLNFFKKPLPPEVIPIEPEPEKLPRVVFTFPGDAGKKIEEEIKEEEKKIWALTGIVEKIEGQTLWIKAQTYGIENKTYQVTVAADAEIEKTKIDPITFIPQRTKSSFDQIKVNDKIITGAGQDIRYLKEFETKHIEIIDK